MRLKRTNYCGALRDTTVGQEVVLAGWVDRYRDHGGIVFIDLRDRHGIAQVVFDPPVDATKEAGSLRAETVIAIRGRVRLRPEGMQNANLPSGKVEVVATDLEILSRAQPLPYSLHSDAPSAGEVEESLRLKHRYLELRKAELQRNLEIRHRFLKETRDFYHEHGFWEIETPILYKSTPEGARDYLVPSRVHPGHFYALPQSPQTLKQLCMIGGLDRYVQIARCFRDEDLRADRQPEFTQIDVEMSFVDAEDILALHEQLLARTFKRVVGADVKTPFRRISYREAMLKYGSDKPDLRNPLEIIDLSDEGKRSTFQVYQTQLSAGGVVRALAFAEREALPRSELDALPGKVASFGAKGVTWIRVKTPGDWQSPAAKFFAPELRTEIERKLGVDGSGPWILLMVCAAESIAATAMGFLRLEFGTRLGLTRPGYEFLWVVDFPLFEYSPEEKRFFAAHHPFTRPHAEDLDLFLKSDAVADLARVRAQAYDIVLNGYEIGGGSLRIYSSDVQARMFAALGLSETEAQDKFGFFLRALQFGTPPHGGIALGVDRICMLLAGTDAIRDVIAFPKTQKASDLMSDAPSTVPDVQLRDLSIALRVKV